MPTKVTVGVVRRSIFDIKRASSHGCERVRTARRTAESKLDRLPSGKRKSKLLRQFRIVSVRAGLECRRYSESGKTRRRS